jgi:hypothetical protein
MKHQEGPENKRKVPLPEEKLGTEKVSNFVLPFQ